MNRNRIEAITGLRGFAALLVVYAHFAEKSWQMPDTHFPGEVGVMIFFSLSGFLISYLYLDRSYSRQQVWDYVTARVARIAPAYLFIVLLSFFIYRWFDPDFVYAISTHNLARHLIFSGNVSVFWSIAPEVQFYALFLLVWLMAARAREGTGIGGLLLIGLLCIVLFSYRDDVPGTFVGSKLHFFLFGGIAGHLRRYIAEDREDRISVGLLQTLLIALMIAVDVGMITFPYQFKVDFYTSMPAALLGALFVLAFSMPSAVGSFLFENRFMKFCGECSFSIYLLNMPLIYLFRGYNQSAMGIVFGGALAFGAILAVAWLNFHVIEKQGARLIRVWSKKLWEAQVQRRTPQVMDEAAVAISNGLEGL